MRPRRSPERSGTASSGTYKVVGLWKGIFQKAKDAILAYVGIYKNAATAVARGVVDGFNFLKSLPGKVGQFLVDVGRKIVDFAGEAFNKAKTVGSNIISGIVSIISNLPKGFLTALTGMGTAIGDTIADAVRGAINWVFDKWNSIELKIPVPGAPDITVGTPDIPRLERGTNFFEGGTALVGRRQP